MSIDDLIKPLEAEWDEPDGFFWKLRQGIFDEAGSERFEALARSADLGGMPEPYRRLVSLLWFAPTFMSWQRGRVAKMGGDAERLDAMTDRIADLLLSDVFGPP
jgi:hypothetical protein